MSLDQERIRILAKAVHEQGGRALLVGGSVRDSLMGRDPEDTKDWDVEVYGIAPAALRELLDRFGEVNVVGEAFAVYRLGINLDVSLPRRERKSGQGHKAFIIEGDPHLSFEEAARRRDFTINAIMQDPLTNEIIDPFRGQSDIEQKILRAVSSETFAEDSLRCLRAAQFAARFEFQLDPGTADFCRGIDVSDLPPERIWKEMEKLLLQAPYPSVGLRLFKDLRITEKLFPEIRALEGVPQDPEWHPEGDVETHTWLVVDQARELISDLDNSRQITLMLGALCHDFGKPATTAFVDDRWRSIGHSEAGIAPTISFLDRLKLFTVGGYDVRAQVLALAREHLKPGEFYTRRNEITDGAFRRLARRCELELLYRVAKADSLGRNAEWVPREKWYDSAAQEWFIAKVRELELERKPPAPILMGRHVLEMGLEPSARVGEITRAIYEMQLDNRVRTLEEAKAAARKMINSNIVPYQSG